MTSSVKRAFCTSTSTRRRSPEAVRTVAAKSTRRTVNSSAGVGSPGAGGGEVRTERSCGSGCRCSISSPSTAPTSRRAEASSSIRYLKAASYMGLAMRMAPVYGASPATGNAPTTPARRAPRHGAAESLRRMKTPGRQTASVAARPMGRRQVRELPRLARSVAVASQVRTLTALPPSYRSNAALAAARSNRSGFQSSIQPGCSSGSSPQGSLPVSNRSTRRQYP